MSEIFWAVIVGFFMLVVLAILGALYFLFGSLIGDLVDKLGFSYEFSLTSVFVGPGLVLLTMYWLGSFVLGVVLSGGLH